MLSWKSLENSLFKICRKNTLLQIPGVRSLAALTGRLHGVEVDDKFTSILGSGPELLMVLLWFTHHAGVWESDDFRRKAEIQGADLLW